MNRTNYFSRTNIRNSTVNIYNNRAGVTTARPISSLRRASVSGQMNRSMWSNRMGQGTVQGAAQVNGRSYNNAGMGRGTPQANTGRTYNNIFADRQARIAQQRTALSSPLGRSWAPSADPRSGGMARSYTVPSQARQAMPQRAGGYSAPQRSFSAPGTAAPRSFGNTSSVGRSFSGGGSRSFSAPGGGSRSFGGGGGGRSSGGGGGRTSRR